MTEQLPTRFSTRDEAREHFIFSAEIGKGSNWLIEKYKGFEIRKSKSGCGGQSDGDFNLAICKQGDCFLETIYENQNLYSQEIFIEDAENNIGRKGAYSRVFKKKKYEIELSKMKKMIDENKF